MHKLKNATSHHSGDYMDIDSDYELKENKKDKPKKKISPNSLKNKTRLLYQQKNTMKYAHQKKLNTLMDIDNRKPIKKTPINYLHTNKIQKKYPDFMDIDISTYNPNLYSESLYKSEYNIKIPLLDSYNIKYNTWNNRDNTAGTCFWHAISKGFGIPFDDLSKKIETLKADLPKPPKYDTTNLSDSQIKDIKTNEKAFTSRAYLADRLRAKKRLGVLKSQYCIAPRIFPDTALVVFFVYEYEPGKFKSRKPLVVCYAPPNNKIPTKVIFLCDILFYDFNTKEWSGHIEIMTLGGKTIQPTWSQFIKPIKDDLKRILYSNSCRVLLRKI